MLRIRRFRKFDKESVAGLIRKTLLTVNSKDYPASEIQRLLRVYTPDKILSLSREALLLVACENGRVIGCGAIGRKPDNENDRIIKAVFVSPDNHRRGIGRAILAALENDAISQKAERIILFSSITAHGFYQRMGFHDCIGATEPDSAGLYKMEKIIRRDASSCFN
jgi:N-acetylglutamate synthase-like GNAT family acetyltransferase